MATIKGTAIMEIKRTDFDNHKLIKKKDFLFNFSFVWNFRENFFFWSEYCIMLMRHYKRKSLQLDSRYAQGWNYPYR